MQCFVSGVVSGVNVKKSNASYSFSLQEYWLCVEMMRVLVLSSMIGFFAEACHLKILTALLLSVIFLVFFVWVKPYKSRSHTCCRCTRS